MIRNFHFKLFCVTVFIATLFVGCGKDEEVAEEVIRPVRYEQVFASGGDRVRTFSGQARASVESKLSFKVAGTVQKVQVNVGDKVKAGQVIAVLDPEDYKLQVQSAEASLTQAQAGERNANANYQRVRLLYENQNASKSDLDGARANHESNKALVSASEKQLELARLQFGYTKLIAPVNGDVATVEVEVNENVSAGIPIVLITAGSKLEVEVAVPEVLIVQVSEGAIVTVTFDAIPDRDFSARVTEVGISSTGVATTFPVTVLLDAKDEAVRAGMAAEVAFNFESSNKKEHVIIPPVAVSEDRQGRLIYITDSESVSKKEKVLIGQLSDEGYEIFSQLYNGEIITENGKDHFVYVVKSGGEGMGTIHRKNVEIGELTASGIEVLEGLEDGDLVVTAGVSRIQDGQKVKVQ